MGLEINNQFVSKNKKMQWYQWSVVIVQSIDCVCLGIPTNKWTVFQEKTKCVRRKTVNTIFYYY